MTALPCPPDRWPVFSRLLDEAMALPAAARDGWLSALPAEHHDLRDAVGRVLASSTQEGDAFLSAPQLPAAPDRPAPAAGRRIGPYELLRPLGRGGMGEVWLARRADGAYARELALKLPHAHLLVGALRERFDRERDILAALSHPHIARFYDAGLAADGQPYLALEAVEGRPITDWCREQGLPLPARLILFDQVLQAVMHAHARLVAHRDLKPANVMVTPEGQVKLLDFGIAKLLQDDGDGTALTQVQGVLATPQYAAPEQLQGGTVSVATDVYALGLMLFELLADRPARTGGARPAATDELPLPSRATDDPARRRALTGDLDAIVHKALQPLPDDRYASVAALADDLARQRRHQPIAARRLTAWHRAAKFLRRHRLPVALSTAVVLALVAAGGGVVWQGLEARAQARRAEAVKVFLLGIFSGADPRLPADKPSGQTPAKALLDRAVARIDERFADDPELRIELLRSAAAIYRELDERAAYRSLQARQLALTRERHGPLDARVLRGELDEIVDAWEQDFRHDRCRQMLKALDARITQARLDRTELRAEWWVSDSICQRDQADQAQRRLTSLNRALALYAEVAPGRRGHVTAQAELGTELQSQLRYAEAVRATTQAIAMAEQLPERNESELATLYSNLGLAQTTAGDLIAAAAAFARAVDGVERTSGINGTKAWLPRSRQARALHLAGERDAAKPLFDALAAALPDPSDPSPDAHTAREDIGERLAAQVFTYHCGALVDRRAGLGQP